MAEKALQRDERKAAKCKGQKGKWLSEEALQIAEKRRDTKGKGERKR